MSLICAQVQVALQNFAALAVWLATYEQVAVIVPYMVAAPLLFAVDESRITLGILVQISNAFGKVFDGFNTVADNWMSVNEWRSVLVRLREFERSHYQNGARARLGDHPVAHVVQMEVVPPPDPPHSPPPPAACRRRRRPCLHDRGRRVRLVYSFYCVARVRVSRK